MSSEDVVVSLLLRLTLVGIGFSGEEKMPSIGSSPCSSRMPLSRSMIPVFLRGTEA